MDWTKKTNDPLDTRVADIVRNHLREISRLHDKDLLNFFCDVANQKNTLHIGCYEHDEKYLNSPSWKHKKINEVAKSCIGLDINSDGIKKMKGMGYEVVHADATSDEYLGKNFETIIAGDVIEHVENIGGLIRFSTKHLTSDGSLYISTPNPFFIGHVISAWTNRPQVANLEHTTWLSESTMLEIARRSGLILSEIIYPIGKSHNSLLSRFLKTATYNFGSSMLFTTIIYRLSLRES